MQRTSPDSAMTTRCVGLPALVPHDSIFFTTGIPSTTRPNTTVEKNSVGTPSQMLFD